jgi:glycosyltransferase involved in cell wall biosynthesis
MFTHDRQIDRRILLEADALQADGWTVRILAMAFPDAKLADDPRVTRVGRGDGPHLGMASHSRLLAVYDLVKKVFPVNSAPMRLGRSIAWNLLRGGPGALFAKVFAEAVEDHPAEVYVAHDLPMLPVGVAALDRHGGHLVYDSHECFPEQEFNALERRVWRRLEATLIGRCDLVMTVNASIAQVMEERYRLARVEVIHNAERVPRSFPEGQPLRERLGLTHGDPLVLYQGGLSEGRNLDALVRMVPHLQTPGVHLAFLGDGLLRDPLEALARRLGVSDRVHLVPAVPQAELLAFTRSADLGVIPYRPNCLNNRLCTPNKLFEFIAAGLPLVASDLPELRRFVVGLGIGMVGDTGSPEALAWLVDAFFARPEVAQGYRAALDRAREEVNWDREGETLVRLYRRFSPAGAG